MMYSSYWINGEPADCLTIADRGLHYGDGVFETIAIHHGQPLLLDAHLDRMRLGCEQLRFDAGLDLSDIHRQAAKSAKEVEKGVMKIIITRGVGARGYRSPAGKPPTCIIGLYPWTEFPSSSYVEGVDVCVCKSRLGHQPLLSGIKHLNRLEQVMARVEWKDEYDEGLMLDQEGSVVEGTMSNVFMVSAGTLVTPLVDRCGIRGVLRAQVLRLASELDMAVTECRVRMDDLFQAEEAFLTNSVIGIWPIKTLEQRRYSAGPITKRLQDAIREAHLAITA
jgi:4-amino-4-deoxychorismate lyase